MSDKLPTSVPLPEVGQYTDNIIFDSLALPIGFDDESLLVNLRAINRVQTMAGLGRLSVIAGSTEGNAFDFSGTVGTDGTVALGGVFKQNKKPLAHVTIEDAGPWKEDKVGLLYANPEAVMRISTNQRDEYAKRSTSPKGLLDPKVQADYLDKALGQGLRRASIDANMDATRIKDSLQAHGLAGVMSAGLIIEHQPALWAALNLSLRELTVNGIALAYIMASKYRSPERNLSIANVFPLIRQSLFFGANYDRCAMGLAAASGPRFIKAAK